MSNLLSYSGINTKVRAMESNLISKDDYNKIANLDTVIDFIAFLKNHPGYRDIFSRYDEHELHRADVERILVNGLYLDYSKIYLFADDAQRNDLQLIFFRYEINILKACIRLVYNSEETYDLAFFKPFFDKHSGINVTALAASHSMEEYILNLKGTEYYPIFIKLQSSNNVSSFDYEMQLDIYYFKKTWKLIDKQLKGESHTSFMNRLGTEIDLLNIMWIYRSKRVYDLSPADILAFIIPVNYKLTKELLIKMAGSTSIDEFMSLLKNSHYNLMYHSIQDDNMESAYKNIVSKIYKVNREKYPTSMAMVNGYLYRKEEEISRLTTALECIRYGLDPQDKLKYILQ